MKYYIGHLVILDDASGREYSRHVCVVAANEDAAKRELDAFAAGWDSGGRPDSRGGWRYGDEGATYAVMPFSLREVSAATLDEMAEILTPLGDISKVSLADKEPAAAVKAVCHRLGEHLAGQGVSVSPSRLLRAASAALGATGWDQLKARVQGKTPAKPQPAVLGGLPRGNAKSQPLRRADELDFAARVDAIWLADGDVALAAQLLHVDGEDLMGSFKDAHEADVAFCSRPANWKPEHSLARDYGILAEADFKVVTEHPHVGHTQVQGWFKGQDAIVFNDHIDGRWHLTGITAPRGELSEVRHQMACYYETLRRAVEARRNAPTRG
jgi:transposase InsO family protein